MDRILHRSWQDDGAEAIATANFSAATRFELSDRQRSHDGVELVRVVQPLLAPEVHRRGLRIVVIAAAVTPLLAAVRSLLRKRSVKYVPVSS